MMQLGKFSAAVWAKLLQGIRENSRVAIATTGIASVAILLRIIGLLQPLEWAALDQFFRLRPQEESDRRILIVEINETDLQKVGTWPIPDTTIAQLLYRLDSLQPRAIGLDLYRDLPVDPGYEEFVQACQSIPNLVGIEKLADQKTPAVRPPQVLKEQDQVGFNNVVLDPDGRVRRSLLYWTTEEGVHEQSFALKLALIYLAEENILPRHATRNPDYLQLGKSIFRPFQTNDGAYVRADAGGYQILANFRGKKGSFETVSMMDVLEGRVSEEDVRDRIVLIGSTAPSLMDFHFTSYSSGLLAEALEGTAGIEIHANLVSQILSSALQSRALIQVWPNVIEWLWIVAWSWVGASLSWRMRSPHQTMLSILLAGGGLTATCYLAFLQGWWLPIVPPVFAMGGSAIAIVGYIAHLQEELKRSKEFLNGVINTIPDPIFVKDKDRKRIVLNDAYCNLLGRSFEELMYKSDYDLFPEHEADVFFQQDRLIFDQGNAQEHEEELTDGLGIKHFIATKRSLHQDAAGNLFLVGVIRDITERKRLEEKLKRTAEELALSNAELKLSGDRLRYLAEHDPLTGLPNMKLFQERLNDSLHWAGENSQLVALLFLDLDGFKSVNDTKGHDMGNYLLKAVAHRLKSCLRGSDTVSRIGGDEFTIILPAIPHADIAARVAKKVLNTLSASFNLKGEKIFITTSIGIGIYPHNGNTGETLIKSADMAMYRAKQSGKNRYEFC